MNHSRLVRNSGLSHTHSWGEAGSQSNTTSCLSVCNDGVFWPNRWMDHDATWYAVDSGTCGQRQCHLNKYIFNNNNNNNNAARPRLRRHCVRWGPSFPKERATATSHFSSHVYCGQTARRIRISPGTEIGLPGDIVLDRNPASPNGKGHSTPPPLFGPCLL